MLLSLSAVRRCRLIPQVPRIVSMSLSIIKHVYFDKFIFVYINYTCACHFIEEEILQCENREYEIYVIYMCTVFFHNSFKRLISKSVDPIKPIASCWGTYEYNY